MLILSASEGEQRGRSGGGAKASKCRTRSELCIKSQTRRTREKGVATLPSNSLFFLVYCHHQRQFVCASAPHVNQALQTGAVVDSSLVCCPHHCLFEHASTVSPVVRLLFYLCRRRRRRRCVSRVPEHSNHGRDCARQESACVDRREPCERHPHPHLCRTPVSCSSGRSFRVSACESCRLWRQLPLLALPCWRAPHESTAFRAGLRSAMGEISTLSLFFRRRLFGF